MKVSNLENRLDKIEELLRSQNLNNKVSLTLDELVLYSGFSKLYLYKLTSKNKIPYYTPPNGKKIFFKKEEIDQWLLNNRQATQEEIEEEAISYAINNLNNPV